MVRREFANGFCAVPYNTVTLNGHPMLSLNTMVEPYNGPWALIAPCGKAVDGEDNRRPHLYRELPECESDANTMSQTGYSVCP